MPVCRPPFGNDRHSVHFGRRQVCANAWEATTVATAIAAAAINLRMRSACSRKEAPRRGRRGRALSFCSFHLSPLAGGGWVRGLLRGSVETPLTPILSPQAGRGRRGAVLGPLSKTA